MRPLALITGASSGIGETYARILARQGYDLIVVARRADRLTALKTQLETKYAIQVEVFTADLLQDADIAKLEQRLRNAQNLTMLINNAGFDQLGDFADVPLEKHLGMLKVHLEATIRLCHAALPAMRQHRQGSIINVSSLAGVVPLPKNSLYSATKAGMVVLSEIMASEEKHYNIAVQVLCPGYTYTEIFDTVGFASFDVKVVPRFLWMSSEDVVNESLARLRPGQALVIPGWMNRVVYWSHKYNPIGKYLTFMVGNWFYNRNRK